MVILGAGFGGLELATRLSESLGDEVHDTLVDQNEAFIFGFSKLEICSAGRPGKRSTARTGTSRDPGSSFVRNESRRSILKTVMSSPPPAHTSPTS